MKKLYSIVLAVATSSFMFSQATLPFNDSFAYPDGPLLAQGNWALLGSANTDQIQVLGGIVKFDGGGEDLQQTITTTPSGTYYYKFDLKVTSNDLQTDANGGYIAGFTQNSTTFGGTIWTKRISNTEYSIGIETRTGTGTATTWSPEVYNIGTTYSIVVSYEFVSGTGNDVTKLYVNNNLVATDTHTGSDLTGIASFFIRQDSVTETPFLEIDNLKVTTVLSEVLLGVNEIQKIQNNFIRNTLVDQEISFATKSSVKIYNMNGQLVKTAQVTENEVLDVSELKSGMYIITGEIEGNTISQKIIKK